jgi:transcriptional regulator with XRE-family HTH domain
MAAQRLANYLKTYRKKSGLTQREVAYLLGWKRGEQFVRYEKYQEFPTLPVALGCQAIFKVPVTELFAGTNDSITSEVGARVEMLAAELEKRNDHGKQARSTARKLAWLAAHHGRPNSPHQ